ncbi:MAG: AAA family ATPase [Lachnospiraceae bacterium]|nr:AAA family ATPase [Lachnospiraceae bacterium]
MQIKEAKIFNFGKLQNVTFRFSEGMNVIYGENERGKSTLHAFLTGMLFGMEKGRGRTLGGDVYSRYEPWHAPSFYSGALRFAVGKSSFYLERNFYSKEKSEYLRNEIDREELSVAYGDLDMLLGGIGREEFGNTYDIPQSGAITGKAMTELLTNYLAEAKAGGNGKVHVGLAQKNLTACKRELTVEKKAREEEREQKLAQKRVEFEVLQEHAMELRSQIQSFEEQQQILEERLTSRRSSISIGVKVAVTILFVLLAVTLGGLAYFHIILPEIAAVAVGIAVVVMGVLWWPRKNETEELLVHARDMLAQMKEHLQENENEIINIEEEMTELQKVTNRELELKENIAAIELAKKQIELVSEEYYMEMADELNAEISKWISLLTKGTYDSARLDKDGKLWILADEREVAPESLSRGTLEQIYLALRLAAGSVIMQEEDMPIFLDEAFAMYDDVRLAETLRALAKTGKQIFIFTCQRRESVILRQEGIAYYEVDMSAGQIPFTW